MWTTGNQRKLETRFLTSSGKRNIIRVMKRIAMLREEFDRQWGLLADNADWGDENENVGRWLSLFESMLTDFFWDVFEDAKSNLEAKPSEFAHNTLKEWCLAADDGRILFEVDNHRVNWKMHLQSLQKVTASEISPVDLIYKPQPKLCLETVAALRTNTPEMRAALSEIHPHFLDAMTNIQKGVSCSTLSEAVENFPVLRGLREDELQGYRGIRHRRTPRTACIELLQNRTSLQYMTIDRYFRPTKFKPR